ncbi:uncharacterized protein PV09_02859 [Verruconis gallopava]|uniref:UDP-galactose transporter homolog 1 n=1 Tax=Verruconis gallopava TaxID=253628 RepID=A0A0D1XUH8_9PEZI|nr:uncharacterized protein PV09_02859 [Verruconis gallopava]KIW06406.1 hypothetical protein PV09_02859 [Verruconis gallopava]
MGRTKSPPKRREPSEITIEGNGVTKRTGNGRGDVSKMLDKTIIDDGETDKAHAARAAEPGVFNLLACVAAIYGAFLTWSVLQERITTTTYGPASAPQRWTHAIFLNTVQSLLASLVGYAYLFFTTAHPHKPGRPAPIFPSAAITKPLILIAITSSLASPFGYASLKHIDYITFVLAKSCKLLPVLFLHVTLFRKRIALYKFAVVVLVTLGVAVFTLHAPSAAAKAAKHNAKNAAGANKVYGLFLLSVNLLFDGLTNTVQDDIFLKFKTYSSPQMMCAMNILATILTSAYLVLSPYVAPTPIGQYIGMGTGNELAEALSFIKAHPQVGYDVVGFALCGALGQVAIYYTLGKFGSLVLTTVTVTRKMLTMLLSVVWFGHRITRMQWLGVGLVFGGIGGEAGMKVLKKKEAARKQRDRRFSEAGRHRKEAGIKKE